MKTDDSRDGREEEEENSRNKEWKREGIREWSTQQTRVEESREKGGKSQGMAERRKIGKEEQQKQGMGERRERGRK